MSAAISRPRRLSNETTESPLSPVWELFSVFSILGFFRGRPRGRDEPAEPVGEAGDRADDDHGGRPEKSGFFRDVGERAPDDLLPVRRAPADERRPRLPRAAVRRELGRDAGQIFYPPQDDQPVHPAR